MDVIRNDPPVSPPPTCTIELTRDECDALYTQLRSVRAALLSSRGYRHVERLADELYQKMGCRI